MTAQTKPETGNGGGDTKPATDPKSAPAGNGGTPPPASDTKAEDKPAPAAGDPAPDANADGDLNLDANDPVDAEVSATLKELEKTHPELSKRQRSALSKKVQKEVEARQKSEKTYQEQSQILERITKDPTVLSEFLKDKGFKLEKVEAAPDPVQVQLAETRQQLVDVFGEEAANKFLPVLQKLMDTVSEKKIEPLKSELEQRSLAEAGARTKTVLDEFIKEIPDAANYIQQIQEFYAQYPGRPENLRETLRNAYNVASQEKRFKSELDKRVEEQVNARIKQMQDAAAAASDTTTPSGSPDAKPVSQAKSGSVLQHLRETMKELNITPEKLREIQSQVGSS